MLYRDVRANETVGREIARLYMEASPELTCMARKAYDAFIRQTEEQYEDVKRCVNVEFVEENPYEVAAQMFADIYHHNRLKVYMTRAGEGHPYLTDRQNDLFRAVHDFNGHYMAGTTFSRHGEEGAWMRHSAMYSRLARRAMTTETRGQNSVLVWLNDGKKFPEQKAILLPEWVSRRPLKQWMSAEPPPREYTFGEGDIIGGTGKEH